MSDQSGSPAQHLWLPKQWQGRLGGERRLGGAKGDLAAAQPATAGEAWGAADRCDRTC